jgi:hypothetical protein
MSKGVTSRHGSGGEGGIPFYLGLRGSNLHPDTGYPEVFVVLHSTNRDKGGNDGGCSQGRLLYKNNYTTG